MPTYRIAGVSVQFPYNAYDCQLVYMERVIHALQQGCNALLESPTGTGKTLCLLCATLAWQQSIKPEVARAARAEKALSSQNDPSSSQDSLKSKLPTILYASRTHSQLQQVIRELKATAYRPKMTVLGSREQTCINSDVQSKRGRVQTHACRSLVKDRKCHHHNRVADYVKTHPELGEEEPVDIEDLVTIGKAHGPCPYYLSRELHSTAEILFLPYNYLIDKENRRSLTGINWQRTVLIFDEAHNLESLCADAASFDLPASHLTGCIGEARQCVELAVSHRSRDNGADTSVDPDNFAVLKALLLELEKRINETPLDSADLGFTRHGSYIYEYLAAMKITWETATVLINTIEQATTLLEDEAAGGLNPRSSGAAYRLLSLSDALKLIFRGTETTHSSCYKMHIHEVRNKDQDKGASRGTGAKVSRTLSWWCFNPGIAMDEFAKMGVRSVILTSGTLAPLDSFACELHLPFKVRLENPHVIDSSQIWVGVVPCGPSGRPLNSSYKTRDSPEYKQELGNTIVNFARIVPDGLLIFFPSYHLLNSCIDAWQALTPGAAVNSSTIWERISKFKQPVVEPKESALFNQANESFREKLSDTSSSGAVFFAVCRGKVSEGLDFADKAGRAVVLTGIPYAMKTDPKIRLKREYLDEVFRSKPAGSKGLRGEEWYVQQASRAVNQAVGRVIRHRHDYGAIILCDERFSYGNTLSQMSLWLRPHVKCYSKFGDAAFTLTRFFRDKMGAQTGPQLVQIKDKKGEVSVNTSLTTFQKDVKTTGVIGTSQRQDSAEILGVKKGIPMGQIMAPSASLGPSQPLSEMLALKRARMSNQSLSSVSIVQANCAVGSTTGFVKDSRNIVSFESSLVRTSECASVTDLASQRLPTLSTKSGPTIAANCSGDGFIKKSSTTSSCLVKCCNSSGKRSLEPLEKPWSLSRTVEHDQAADTSARPTTTMEGSTRDPGKPSTRGENDGNADKKQQAHEASTKPAVLNEPSSASNEKKKNAAEFLLQVKAHLSVVEYKRFLEHMRSLRNQVMNMPSLLKAVSNLFGAPERLFLFERFGDFIPSKSKPLFEQCLAARRAEFADSQDPQKVQTGEHEETSFKACFTFNGRKSGADKRPDT